MADRAAWHIVGFGHLQPFLKRVREREFETSRLGRMEEVILPKALKFEMQNEFAAKQRVVVCEVEGGLSFSGTCFYTIKCPRAYPLNLNQKTIMSPQAASSAKL